MRRAIETATDAQSLRALWDLHAEIVSQMAEQVPSLRSERGEHYAEILTVLYRKRLLELQKSALTLSPPPAGPAPRRIRDKEHLRAVGKEPCLICGRRPSQAHHLKFLQPRGLGLKPSDEYAVPLCRLHHRSLHDAGDEEAWWSQHKIDPAPEAERLWSVR